MNILVVCQYFWPEPFRVLDVCLGLQEKGHKVTVLTGVPNYPEGRFYKGYGIFHPLTEMHQGIKIVRIPLIPRMDGKGLQLALNYLSFAINSMLMAPFLCKGHFDMVFTYQLSPVTMALPSILIKKLKKAALVHYVLDLWPESLAAAGGHGEGMAFKLVCKLVSYIYSKSDLILASSKGFIPKMIERGADPECVKYWPQWAEKVYSEGLEQLGDYPLEDLNCFKIVFAGNIGEAQSFGTLLDAAELIKEEGREDIHWNILGDGRLKRWVEEEIEKRNLQDVFHLLGRRPIEEMPYYYRRADALLVSLKENELFSLTLPAKVQSYLASGKPIIAAMNGEGARVVAEAGAGLTCRAEDPKALAGLIIEMSRLSLDERKELGRKGKEYFDLNYSRDVLLERLDSYIRNGLV